MPDEANQAGIELKDVPKSHARGVVGIVLSRVVTPLWILAGVTFKLIEHTPRSLPETVRTINDETFNFAPHMWLSILIGLELLAIGVMFFSRRFARVMAIFMLGCFCLILLNEMRIGNLASCGCFGKLPMPPWLTLVIDSVLLLGVLICAPRYVKPGATLGAQLGGALAWTAAGFALSFVMVLPHGKKIEPQPTPPGGGGQTAQSTRPPLEGIYYIEDADAWVGKSWQEVELFRYIDDWPEGMDSGQRYVIFFLQSCEHCRDLLETHFDAPAPVPTVLVAIPESTEGFDDAAALTMFFDETGIERRELPIGPDWLLTGPIVVALEDGVIRCIKEGDDVAEPACLIWH